MHPFLPIAAAVVCAAPGAAPPASEPVTPEAVPAARRVLALLADLPSRERGRLVAGQFIGHSEYVDYEYCRNVVALHAASGRWPALLGADYGWLPRHLADHDLAGVNAILVEHARAGGLVTVSFHGRNPWTGGSAWDCSRVGELDELLDSSTAAGLAWQRQLEGAAAGLEELQRAGVAVLWRPFHEMNGGWFWWTASRPRWPTPEAFARLWRHQFRYFTETRGLRHLLWVYSVSSDTAPARRPVEHYYPGDDLVDIIGWDRYADDLVLPGYELLAAKGKPLGLTEFGPGDTAAASGSYDYRLLLAQVRSRYPRLCFFQAWCGGGRLDWSLARHQRAADLLADPWVLDRDALAACLASKP
jgi:mannan endo-1,4-beta-mannosidase